jgi:acyl-CoA dehydrogenase
MYLASAVLKHFENQGRRATDLPLVEWSVRTLMYQAQEQLHSFLRNFPNRPVAFLLRCFIFPRGRTYSAPSDELSRKLVNLMTRTGEARDRLSAQAYTTLEPGNPLGQLQQALELSEALSPLLEKLKQANKEGLLKSEYLGFQIHEAQGAEIITADEAGRLRDFHEKVMNLMSVDDFDSSEIGRAAAEDDKVSSPRAAAARKKPAAKKSAKAGNKRGPGKKTTGDHAGSGPENDTGKE